MIRTLFYFQNYQFWGILNPLYARKGYCLFTMVYDCPATSTRCPVTSYEYRCRVHLRSTSKLYESRVVMESRVQYVYWWLAGTCTRIRDFGMSLINSRRLQNCFYLNYWDDGSLDEYILRIFQYVINEWFIVLSIHEVLLEVFCESNLPSGKQEFTEILYRKIINIHTHRKNKYMMFPLW